MQSPSLSVVTVCFNNLDELKTTIASVDAQQRLPEEHLIIDGSTQPAIREYLEQHPQPTYRRWICEPDEGISDAFNKGIRQARHTVVHLLNSGDYYFDTFATQQAMQAFEGNNQLQWLHGKYAQFRGGTWVVSGKPFDPTLLYRGMRQLGHQTFFVKKNLYETYGGFDKALKRAMDYDFLVRIAHEPFHFIAKPLVVFTPGGVSSLQVKESLQEVVQTYEKYHGRSLKAHLWMLRSWALAWFTNSTVLGKWIFQWKNRHQLSKNGK